jgi:hypothetical protein
MRAANRIADQTHRFRASRLLLTRILMRLKKPAEKPSTYPCHKEKPEQEPNYTAQELHSLSRFPAASPRLPVTSLEAAPALGPALPPQASIYLNLT